MASSTKVDIETLIPSLAGTDYELTSPIDKGYNCIAWATGCNHRFWWPNAFWPSGAPTNVTIAAFKSMFETLDFKECESADLETGYEKIAVFNRMGEPAHASRQLENGKWTSKLGGKDDISHQLDAINGVLYGTIVLYMKRQIARRACPHE